MLKKEGDIESFWVDYLCDLTSGEVSGLKWPVGYIVHYYYKFTNL